MELTYENAETASPSDKKQNWLTAFELQATWANITAQRRP